MKRKKLREHISHFPRRAKPQAAIDNFVVSVFHQKPEGKYFHSARNPEKRFGIAPDQHFLDHLTQNDLYDISIVPSFTSYGTNEKYLISKVLFSKVPLLLMVGSMGTGKSRFRHFLIGEVIRGLKHHGIEAHEKCPFVITVDFLDVIETFKGQLDPLMIEKKVTTILCDRIENAIYAHKFFSLDQEVTTVWSALIETASRQDGQNEALDRISVLLRAKDLVPEDLAKLSPDQFSTLVAKRKELRAEVLSSDTYRRSYWAAVLRYVRETHFHGHEMCSLLFIDNIDLAPLLVQQSVKIIMKPFARVSRLRTVITLRQTTYYQYFEDRFSDPIDVVAHCGPSPLDIILAKLRDCVADMSQHSVGLAAEAAGRLSQSVARLSERLSREKLIQDLFCNLCGYNIRKALILAQNFVHNSIYDPVVDDMDRINVSDVLRAILVGGGSSYEWTQGGMIENVFQIHETDEIRHLLKLRILSALSNVSDDTGMDTSSLKELLVAFGYPLELIRKALNQLMLETKELVWSDRDLSFETAEEFAKAKGSNLFASIVGQDYRTYISKRLDYVQEVMLDTFVVTELGGNWDYGIREQRLRLVSEFLLEIHQQDVEEVKRFIGTEGRDKYFAHFGRALLSREICEGVADSVFRIFGRQMAGRRRGERRENSDADHIVSRFEILVEDARAEEEQILR